MFAFPCKSQREEETDTSLFVPKTTSALPDSRLNARIICQSFDPPPPWVITFAQFTNHNGDLLECYFRKFIGVFSRCSPGTLQQYKEQSVSVRGVRSQLIQFVISTGANI